MRYLIVGLGNIGQKRKAVLGKKCVATVDPNPKANADFLDYKKVPLDLFDSVVLTIPQQLKNALTEYFLAKGKNVLVEKPLIISQKQGKKFLQIAKKNDAIWHASYNHRFEPNIVKLKKLLNRKIIGKLYFARFIYSFGNIKDRINTWRETEFGVLEEITPHQLDLIFNLLKNTDTNFQTIIARKVESNIFDHWLFTSMDKKITVECSAITWKNVFLIEIYGRLGSVHINGLRKWNGSELIIRKRTFPSEVPKEKKIFDQGPDNTWSDDFNYFEKMVRQKQTSIKNDLQISLSLANIALNANTKKESANKTYRQIQKNS